MKVRIGDKIVPDAIEVMDQRYGKDNPEEWKRLVAEERFKLEVGQIIYDLRKEAGLSQTALARLIGTGQSIISRAEHGDYEGSCLDILRRICLALNKPISISRNTDEAQGVSIAC